jgi:hypothetical protein
MSKARNVFGQILVLFPTDDTPIFLLRCPGMGCGGGNDKEFTLAIMATNFDFLFSGFSTESHVENEQV